MPAIREELTLVDSFSGTFRQFNTAANASIATAEAFRDALNSFAEGFVNGFTEELMRTNAELDEAANGAHRAAQGADDAADAQKRVTNETKATADAASGWVNHIKSAVAALGVAKFTKEFVETADQLTLINARLDAVADKTLGVGELQEQIFAAAQRSRASYQDTANLVARIAQNARGVFNNAEAVKFAENMNKSFKLAGANQQEMASATLQLSQALATGILRGEEFNAVNEAAPAVIKQIADAMGVEVTQMRQMAQDGKITADIIKNAMLNASDQIDESFDIDKTWEDMMTEAKNSVTWALSDIMEQWTEFLNSAEGQQIFEDVLTAIINLAQFGSEALMALVNAIAWVHQNWEDLLPIIDLVAAAVLVYAGVQAAAAIEAAAMWIAQAWPLLILVGIIAAAIGICQHFGVTFAQVGSFVGSIIGYIYATAYNYIMLIWGALEWIGSNFGVAMNNLGADVIGIINIIGQTALDMVNTVASAIDSVFGSNLSGAVGSLSNQLQTWSNGLVQRQAYTELKAHDYISVNATMAEFGAIGEKLGGKLDNMNLSLDGILGGVNSLDASAFNLSDNIGGSGEVGKVGSVGKIDNDVTLSDEDLRVYRDLAEQRYQTSVELQTLAPNINVTMPDGSNLSPHDVANAIKAILTEQMSANAATAH